MATRERETENWAEIEPQSLPQKTLCFALKGDEILLGWKKIGFGKNRWNGAGGKIDPMEFEEDAALRELSEEFGIIPQHLEKVAEITFTFPENPDEDWDQLVHVYLTRSWEGEITESDEMKPRWFPIDEIPYNAMWSADRLWLPEILKGEEIRARFSFDENQQVLEHEIRTGLPLKFYLAGPFSEREKIRDLMRIIKEIDHRLAYDWTNHLPVKPYEENSQLAAQYAREDISGVFACDVFVLIPDKEGGTTQFAELGAAISHFTTRRIFVVGPYNNRSMIFFHPKVERVASFEEMLSQL